MDTVHHDGWMRDVLEVGKALTGELLPVSKGRYLRLSDRRSRHRLPIRLALAQAFDEGGTGRLARLRRRKEDFLQHRVALKLGIAEILREARFIEVHDVFAAAGRGADEDHSSKDGRPVQRDLLRDHAAERITKNVAVFESEPVQERQGVPGHSGDCGRHLAGGPAETGAFEQNDLAPECTSVGDRRIPVVERSSEVLKTQ